MNRKKKRRPIRILRRSLNNIRFPFISKFIENYSFGRSHKTLVVNKTGNFNLTSFFYNNIRYYKKDTLNKLLKEIYPAHNINNKIMSKIDHKSITGVKIEVSGKLSRRLASGRSITITEQKGSLKNITHSSKNYSSVLLRGYNESNIQYSNINYKARNGAFGLKVLLSNK